MGPVVFFVPAPTFAEFECGQQDASDKAGERVVAAGDVVARVAAPNWQSLAPTLRPILAVAISAGGESVALRRIRGARTHSGQC